MKEQFLISKLPFIFILIPKLPFMLILFIYWASYSIRIKNGFVRRSFAKVLTHRKGQYKYGEESHHTASSRGGWLTLIFLDTFSIAWVLDTNYCQIMWQLFRTIWPSVMQNIPYNPNVGGSVLKGYTLSITSLKSIQKSLLTQNHTQWMKWIGQGPGLFSMQ